MQSAFGKLHLLFSNVFTMYKVETKIRYILFLKLCEIQNVNSSLETLTLFQCRCRHRYFITGLLVMQYSKLIDIGRAGEKHYNYVL